MKAFVLESIVADGETRTTGCFKVDEPMPVLGPSEALVRVLRAGVCNTDLELLSGYMGFKGIIGHEFVGVVEEVNAEGAYTELIGKRVVGEINLACMNCPICERGGERARNHCPERTVLGILAKHGTYAEYISLPCRNLHQVPDTISDGAAVFVEPLAAACRIVEQGLAPPEANIAVLGDGKLGLLITEVLARRRAPSTSAAAHDCVRGTGMGEKMSDSQDITSPGWTTIIGRHSDKMSLCCAGEEGDRQNDMLIRRVNASDEDSVQAMAGSFDLVVDATGSPQGLASASTLCRPLGTVVLKSTCAAGAGFNPAPIVINEQKVVGSRCGPFDMALKMLADESAGLDVERYVTGVFPLQEADSALEAARRKGALKIQIVCSE